MNRVKSKHFTIIIKTVTQVSVFLWLKVLILKVLLNTSVYMVAVLVATWFYFWWFGYKYNDYWCLPFTNFALCSCLRSALTSRDIFNFAHYIAKIKRLSRVFLRVFPVKPRNTYVAVYFFALNKAQRARENERNMSAFARKNTRFRAQQSAHFWLWLAAFLLRLSCISSHGSTIHT